MYVYVYVHVDKLYPVVGTPSIEFKSRVSYH